MTSLVYLAHVATVFAIPIFFGWLVLRRAVREHDLAILVPGSVLVGFVSLMALMNELRFWLEMPAATWFAYKFLLALSLALLVFGRKPRSVPILGRGARSAWKVALVLFGTAVTAVYFGIPAFKGILNDAWWFHYPMATQMMTTEHFPLYHPLAMDDPLYYHFGPDILVSVWSFLLDCPVKTGYAIGIVCLAPLAFLLAFGLGLRVSKNYWAALCAATFVVVGGNLRFFHVIGAELTNPARRIQIFNSQTIQGLLQMVFTPSHALGIPLVLLLLAVFRHFYTRPTWSTGAVLGLLLGPVTLVAEWYFFPLFAALGLCLGLKALRTEKIRRQARLGLLVAPLAIALGWGLFNNTYVAGLVAHYWMRYPSSQSVQTARIVSTDWGAPGTPQEPTWVVPALIPLKLNSEHLGYAPSWEDAGSDHGTWVALWGSRFLIELFPVVGLGIPFGILLWLRRRQPLVGALVVLAIISALPPLVLDWGDRSTDFLRFFTGSFSFSAILLGLAAGDLLTRPRWRTKAVGLVLIAVTLGNAAGLGYIGLMPSTVDAAMAVGSEGGSLSDLAKKLSRPNDGAAATSATPAGATSVSKPTEPALSHEAAYEKLTGQLNQFLYPITLGRDRAIVIVPVDQLPPLQIFPEWMKLGTMSRILLPFGWYWKDSAYAAYYKKAVQSLDSRSIAALGAHWIIVTDLWGYTPPAEVSRKLADPQLFLPIRNFRAGAYSLQLYRVR